MNDWLYKHVLFKDLAEYVRRTDYFDGYSETEKAWIRKNLGILGESEAKDILDNYTAGVISGTYTEIAELTYKPGFIYIITDGQTIYREHGQTMLSDLYLIVLFAISESLLSKDVTIISSDPTSLLWDVKYDITLETLEDGTKTKGKIIYLKDQNLNQANYDFKNIRFKIEDKLLYTFSSTNGNENSSACFGNNLCNSYRNVFIGESSYNIIQGLNNYFKLPINYLIGNISNLTLDLTDVDFSTDTIKQIVNEKYIDYLDFETLTHLFYAIDTTR